MLSARKKFSYLNWVNTQKEKEKEDDGIQCTEKNKPATKLDDNKTINLTVQLPK
jgi:hypothetical protein